MDSYKDASNADASNTAAGPVVVGVDSSDGARHAAVWAADLAATLRTPLCLVHVVPDEPRVTEVPPWLGELLDTVQRAGADPPRAEILRGSAVGGLAGHAVGARLLVLGSYGDGARSGMLAGSVAFGLVGGVACPVAVVRGLGPAVPPPHSGPVVVGVDGSAAGRAALVFAAGLAASLGARLVALHAWTDVVPDIRGGARRRPEDPSFLEAEGAALLRTELDAVAACCPGLDVQGELVRDTPVRALLARADDARMLVVGCRGDGAGPGILFSSTSGSLVDFAPCPVVVTSPVAATAEPISGPESAWAPW